MAKTAQKYPRVPPSKLTSIDVVSFDAGIDERGDANIKPNSFTGRNVMVTPQGLATHRLGLKRWLPDIVGTAGQAYPADYNGTIYFVTADDGQIKYCKTGDAAWTVAGGDNTVTTSNVSTTVTTTTNMVTNPSIETGISSWFPLNGVETLAQSNAQAYVGTYSLKVTTTGSGTQGGAIQVSSLTPGSTVTISAYVYVPNGVVYNLGIDQFNGGTYLNSAGNYSLTGTGAWQRVTYTTTLLSNANTANIYVSTAAATTVYIDAVQAEYGSTATDYFDGSTPASGNYTYAWSGVAHGSTSVRTLTVKTPVVSPNPTTFLRILDKVLILNGTDNLGYLDLTTMNVVHFNHVNDPSSAPTAAYVGTLASGSYKIYYCISYNSVAGKTIGSPILTQSINKIREQWASNGSDGLTITDTNTRPAGAVSWNVYLATAPSGGTIALSDMLPIALHLDIATTTFTDNGSITQITDSGTAPQANSTAGPKAKYGVEINGRPFLYGVTNDPYAVMIGGDGDNALDFTEGNGGYRLVLNQGTDYYPSAIIGFRNGQGVPSITVLYSSVSGLSKASIIDQNTVTLGTYSLVVWGSIDQNYGAAGVASPYAVVNYRGRLVFLSTDGVTNIDTSSLRFNVLTATRISDAVIKEVGSIKSDRLGQAVGTAWANRIMFAVPANGFDTNNKILVYDVTRTNGECWYTFDIAANWIGTVSPPGAPGFVYVAQGNHFFQLTEMYVAQDETSTGVTQAFPMELNTAVIGQNAAHDGYFALVQAVLYMRDFIGNVNLILSWRDRQSGNMVTKTKTFSAGTYAKSTVGNWSSPGYLFNAALPVTVLRWGENDLITDGQVSQKTNPRFRLRLNNVITNELQATVAYNPDNSGGTVRSISFQGQALGISPDV